MKKRSRILWIAGLAAAALVGAWVAVRWFRESPDAFSWDTVDRGEIRETINASGEIQAKTRINIGTSVTGEIKVLHVKDGQDVKAGDLLVTIDRERLKQETSQAEGRTGSVRAGCRPAGGDHEALPGKRLEDRVPLQAGSRLGRGTTARRSWPARARR